MSFTGFLILLLIAALCGSIAQLIGGYSLGGCITSTVLGFIGALIGGWLAETLDLPLMLTVDIDGRIFPIIWSIIGAVIFVVVIGLVTRRRS